MNGNDELAVVRSIMRDVRVAMMTSIAADGSLTSRPMATQETEFDGDAWFIVDRNSDAVQEIIAEPSVDVSYSGGTSWLSLAGRA